MIAIHLELVGCQGKYLSTSQFVASFSCVIQHRQAGALLITFFSLPHLLVQLVSFSSSPWYFYLVSVSIPSVTQGRALVLTTCNCIVRIVLVKSGDDDIHVVVVWTFTPGDDWSVVSATASVIGVDASDTYGNWTGIIVASPILTL